MSMSRASALIFAAGLLVLSGTAEPRASGIEAVFCGKEADAPTSMPSDLGPARGPDAEGACAPSVLVAQKTQETEKPGTTTAPAALLASNSVIPIDVQEPHQRVQDLWNVPVDMGIVLPRGGRCPSRPRACCRPWD